MNSASTRRVLALTLPVLASLAIITFQRSTSATLVDLVVINVLVSDKVTGLPIQNLTYRDFKVFDNGRPAEIRYFHAVPDSDANSVSFWLIVGCASSRAESRTAAVRKRVEFAQHVLAQLAAKDTVGVARWCETTATAKVDLGPTADRQAALQAISDIPGSDAGGDQDSEGYAALLKLLQRINAAPTVTDFVPLPVLLFFEPERMSSSREQAQQFAQEVLSRSSLVICPAREDTLVTRRLSRNSVPLLPHLAKETGGQVFSTERFDGSTGIDAALAALHVRYQLAYWTGAHDRGWHKVEIKLVKGAVPKGTPVTMSYRSGYLDVGTETQYKVSDSKHPSTLESALARQTLSGTPSDERELLLSAQGALHEGNSRSAQLKLKVDQTLLSWSAEDEGRQRAELGVRMDLLPSDGEALEPKLTSYVVTRREPDAWSILRPIEISMYAEIPENTARIRFTIRDDSSGWIGIKELAMQDVLAAPRPRSIIF